MSSDLNRLNVTVQTLQRSAGNGEVTLQSGAAESAARACAQMIASLRQLQWRVDRLSRIEGCEGFTSSEMLAAKLGEVAGPGDGNFAGVLQQHIDVLTKLQDVYLKAGKGFLDAEGKNSSQFEHLDAPVTTYEPKTGRWTTTNTKIGVSV